MNNFVPLLFLTFHSSYHIPLIQITFLVTLNFTIQLLVDLASVAFVDRIGYRLSLMIAHGCAVLCLVSYLVISLCPVPAISLIACGICGFSVGIFWPGIFSMATAALPLGGTAMFALLALGGDVGCSSGPTYVGALSSALGGDLKKGILLAIVFPILMLAGLALLRPRRAMPTDHFHRGEK